MSAQPTSGAASTAIRQRHAHLLRHARKLEAAFALHSTLPNAAALSRTYRDLADCVGQMAAQSMEASIRESERELESTIADLMGV